MFVFVEIKDLVANAFIEYLESNMPRRSISFQTLREYGIAVEKTYSKRNGAGGMIQLYGRDYLDAFEIEYRDYFLVKDDGIELQDGVDADDLRKRFRSLLSYDLLCAFINPEARRALEIE